MKNFLTIKKFNKNHSNDLLKIFNSGVESNQFFNNKKILKKEHENWLNLNFKTFIIFVLQFNNKVIGYCRFDKKEKNIYKISIAILKKYRNKGFGEYLLKNSIKKIKNKNKNKLVAIVKKNNLRSLVIFLKNNFRVLNKKNSFRVKSNNYYMELII